MMRRKHTRESVETYRTSEGQHVARNVPSCETFPRIGEKVLPFTLENGILRGVCQCGILLGNEVLLKIGL